MKFPWNGRVVTNPAGGKVGASGNPANNPSHEWTFVKTATATAG